MTAWIQKKKEETDDADAGYRPSAALELIILWSKSYIKVRWRPSHPPLP